MAISVSKGYLDSLTTPAGLEWSVAQAAKTADGHNGDGFIVQRDDDQICLAVVDGVGSGIEANKAANVCLKALADVNFLDFPGVFAHCHTRLIGTRGAALALAMFDLSSSHLIWAAVGDIDGCVFREGADKTVASMVQRAGTLGHSFQGVYTQSHRLADGDVVAICSDGVSRRYRNDPPVSCGPADFAENCVKKFGRNNDDRTFAAVCHVMRAA